MLLSGGIRDGEVVPVVAGPAGLMIGDVSVGAEKRPVGATLN